MPTRSPEVRELHPDRVRRLVEDGPNVDVALVLVAAQQIESDLDQPLGRFGDRCAQQAPVAQQPLVVLGTEQQPQPAGLLAVGADALEDARAVVERVRRKADLRLVERDDLALEVGPCPEGRTAAVPGRVRRRRLGSAVMPGLPAGRRAPAARAELSSSRRSGRASSFQMAYSKRVVQRGQRGGDDVRVGTRGDPGALTRAPSR